MKKAVMYIVVTIVLSSVQVMAFNGNSLLKVSSHFPDDDIIYPNDGQGQVTFPEGGSGIVPVI